MKKALANTKVTVKLRKSEYHNEWYLIIESYPVFKPGSTKPKRVIEAVNRTITTPIWDTIPYFFTYQSEDCKEMPNTNNKIEGSFTDLKKNLNNHSGLTMENRRRFISGFFLALTETLSMKKQEPR